MTARRPLLTAAAAGSVLFALWFVPSANALVGDDGATHSALRADSASAGQGRANVSDASGAGKHSGSRSGDTEAGNTGSGSTTTRPGGGPAADGGAHHYLADTGSPDTTPYVVGGAGFLVLGAALVSYSVHRTRDETV
ncbi:hypothetical protein ADL22_17705 [Streptomyces sp. NRRL F-4489]|uniref:hypothetical protein n=1 Tax=Streptomyces sp. NRRL F-4489 TaxID=1609095 RepID=UPI00074757C7|nr:hypothetical protein [Streptomyces sp. NRRL F-4489]KUL38607.1 hypothetical protein ADL22_17705 [Streptomyces sp. NRRL F-4489]